MTKDLDRSMKCWYESICFCECEYLWLWECSSFRVAGISSSSSSCSWLRGCPLAWTTVNKTSWMLSCQALYSNRKWRTLPSYATSSPSVNAASSSCMIKLTQKKTTGLQLKPMHGSRCHSTAYCRKNVYSETCSHLTLAPIIQRCRINSGVVLYQFSADGESHLAKYLQLSMCNLHRKPVLRLLKWRDYRRYDDGCVFKVFPWCHPVNLNPWMVYNHMDSVIMWCDPDPDRPNILESDEVKFFR